MASVFTLILAYMAMTSIAFPTESSTIKTLVKRDSLHLNIEPSIVNPNCSALYEASITVEYTPDPFYLSNGCQNFLDFVGGAKGNKKVEIIFACSKQPVDASTLNLDDSNIVFFVQGNQGLNGDNNSDKILEATMEVIDKSEQPPLTTDVSLVVRLDNNKHTSSFRGIIC